jgi:hypothetical protein
MRLLMIAAVAALAFTSASYAKTIDSASPKVFTLDAKGKCHDAAGKFVASSMCHAGKHCVKGKACGDTCIKATDICHKPS